MVTTAAGALAAATASLVRDYDMVGTLSQLCADCAEVTGASAAGVMLADGDGPLEMMAASSHAAGDIELYEIESGEGPGAEAFATGRSVTAASAGQITARWPVFGARAASVGLQSVQACPLTWRGGVIGALNVFRQVPGGLDAEQQRIVQAFADVATIAIIHAGLPPVRDLAAAAKHALQARAVIEQAKGVIAAQDGIGMAESFDYLRHMALRSGQLLETVALEIVMAAARPAAAAD